MSRRAHVRVAVACLFLWGTLDRPVTGQSTPTGRGQATRSVEAAPREPPRSVAVLPFTNISRSPADAWLSRGIAETVTADLRERPGLSVIGPEQLWDGGWVDLGAVLAVDLGRQLGARWLVRGGYQRVGERIRITARLIDARDGTLIQSVKVDGPVSDIFALQDRLMPELASGLALTAGAPGGGVPEPRAPVRIARGESSPGGVGRRQAPTAPVPPVPNDNDIGASRIEGTRGRPRAIDRAVLARPGATAAAATARPAGPPVDPGVPAVPAPGVAGVPIDGPPPPVPPATVARDGQGRVTIRATHLPAPLRVDGQLDEGPYSTVEPIGDFIQLEPTEGALATELTDVWIFFDDDSLYISGRCWDSAPEARWILNEMRRDGADIYRDENFTVVLDTFYDRRNGYFFQVNPIGGLFDAQITDGAENSDWNPVWDVRTGRFEGGWTFEMVIPFRSLRYQPGKAQVWGVNFRRFVQWKNEFSFVVPMPASFGFAGIYQFSLGGTLVGLEAPPGGKNLEIKPYGISGVTTDRRATPPISDALDGDLGLDVKYGVTQNLTADFTYNTDFAQVEVDEQQVNLTRFSLFFPEKREFFLEGRGIFEFGGARQGFRGVGSGDTPFLFFSRRIGLSQGRAVPILGGARLTGKVGRYTIGLLDIQTDDAVDAGALATNFGVVRLKRDIFRRSAVGVLFAGRSQSTLVDGSNRTYGLDAAFRFHDDLRINTYVAKTETPGLPAQDLSYRGQFDYAGDRYGLQLERLVIEENFNPEIGFVRRPDMRKSFASARFSPRPRSIAAIRKLSWQGSFNSIENNAGVLETREARAQFGIEFENTDLFGIGFSDTFEFLERPFLITPGVTLPVGGYDFQDVSVSYTVGQRRRLQGNISVQHGTFFSGEKTTVGFGRGRFKVTPQVSVEPSLSLNWVDLPEGSFRTELIQSRITYTPTPRMFFTGFLQYNSSNDTIGTNLRLRWEYQPGSELFVVYTDERDTLTRTFPEIINRAFTVKVTRLFRF